MSNAFKMCANLILFLLQPPLRVYGIEGRYAHALYSAASKEKKLEAVEKEMKSFQVIMYYFIAKSILQSLLLKVDMYTFFKYFTCRLLLLYLTCTLYYLVHWYIIFKLKFTFNCNTV